VYYTAAGDRGEARPSYVQRVFEARAQLITHNGQIRLDAAEHRELVRPDGRTYLLTDQLDGGPDRIRVVPRPGLVPRSRRRPRLSAHRSLGALARPVHGAVALAVERAGRRSLHPPLVEAAGINHGIERPHVVAHAGRYYHFFCTRRHDFHPPGSAPTGLYGFVAAGLEGPWEPLNQSGLVIQNPPSEPDQTYAWLVLPDLRVVSFLDYRSSHGRTPEDARTRFGGTMAPTLRLALDGATAYIVETRT
jgi:levansucrase